MTGLHEAALGRPPSARTQQAYRKLTKRASWSKVQDEIDRTLTSIRRNFNLRKTGQHLGMNEASKLNLFGEFEILPAIFDLFACISHFSKKFLYFIIISILGRLVDADHLGTIEDPWHFKQFWKKAFGWASTKWDILTSDEVPVTSLPASRASMSLLIRFDFPF